MTDAKQPDAQQHTIDRTKTGRSPTFLDVYANDIFLQVSKWDVRMMFSVITELGADQTKPGLLRVADVRLSLQQAKRLSELLSAQITAYETKHGPIAIAKDA